MIFIVIFCDEGSKGGLIVVRVESRVIDFFS